MKFHILCLLFVMTLSGVLGHVSIHVTNETIAGTKAWLTPEQQLHTIHDKEIMEKKCKFTTDITANMYVECQYLVL